MKTAVFLISALILFSCSKENSNKLIDNDFSIDQDQEIVKDSDILNDETESDDDLSDEALAESDDETEPDDDLSDEALAESEVFDTESDDETFEVDDEISDDDEDAAEVPLDGFGLISGSCGVLDDELVSGESFFFLNSIDFLNDPYDEVDYAFLTEGGQKILDDVSAGNSVYSKVFAYEVLARCEFAGLLKTENEIGYDPDTERTDIIVNIDGLKIGVSVTKAVKFPFDLEYTVADAQTLLSNKLNDIVQSSQNVLPEDKWEKQILHIIAYSDSHAFSIETAYNSLDASTKTDTIVFVTVSDGDDSFLY